MKKKLRFFAVILTVVFFMVSYKVYTDKQIDYYLKYFSNMPGKVADKSGFTGEVKLKRVIKRSPKELIMIVNWGDHDAYISIENWLTGEHDYKEIRGFSEKRITIIE